MKRYMLVVATLSASLMAACAVEPTDDQSVSDEAAVTLAPVGAGALDAATPFTLGATLEVSLKSRQAPAIFKINARPGMAIAAIAKAVSAQRTAEVHVLKRDGVRGVAVDVTRASGAELATDITADGDFYIAIFETKSRAAKFNLTAAEVTALSSDCADGMPEARTLIDAAASGETPEIYADSSPLTTSPGASPRATSHALATKLESRACHPVTGCAPWQGVGTSDDAGNFMTVHLSLGAGDAIGGEITFSPNPAPALDRFAVTTGGQAMVDASGRAGFIAKLGAYGGLSGQLAPIYRTESVITRARIGKSCAVSTGTSIKPTDGGGYVELRAVSRAELAPLLAPAVRLPSSDTPPRASACDGAPLTRDEIVAKFAPGAATITLVAKSAVEEKRTCHRLTSCSTWTQTSLASVPGAIVIDAAGTLAYRTGSQTSPIGDDGRFAFGEVRASGVSISNATIKSNVDSAANQWVEAARSACDAFAP